MAAKFGASETGNEARADDAEQGERLGGVHAIFYPPAIAVLKRGEGGGLWNQRWNQAGGPEGKSPYAAADYCKVRSLPPQPVLRLLSSLYKRLCSRRSLGAFGNEISNAQSSIELGGVVHHIDHIGLSRWLASQHIPRGATRQVCAGDQ